MKTVTVSADALQQVLEALIGPSHLIRELQVIRNLPGGGMNPIGVLITEYNAAAEIFNIQQKAKQSEEDKP